MPTEDQRIDAYIEKSADFARPILEHLRNLVHTAVPDVIETIKWSMPFFDHKGPLCHMAAFKAHCAFGFWKKDLLEFEGFGDKEEAMGSFGRITSLKDLPKDKVLIALIRRAAELNEAGIKAEPKPKAAKEKLAVPKILTEALKQNAAAKKTFDEFSESKRRDYIEWITEAKTEPTREKRLAATIRQLAEGKSRQWKYEKKK